VHAAPITSMTFNIDSVHPDFTGATFEFGAGEGVRFKSDPAAGTRRGDGAATNDRDRAPPLE
jgi:hypothetical protein